jgi:hypothetical protein
MCLHINCLIAVSETTHTTHDTKNVVVGSINANFARTNTAGSGANGAGSQRKLKSSVVDTRHVAGAGRLVFFGFKTEGINVDTGSGAVGVVLVRLNQVEVATITFRESVVAVELEFGRSNGVYTTVKNGIDGSKTELNATSKSGIV